MMLSNILQALSGTVGSIFLGQMIGPGALAAAGVFFPIMVFFISLVIGMGVGASVPIGQAWGPATATGSAGSPAPRSALRC